MIRYAVLTIMVFYFAGAEIIQPIVPPVVDVATRAFYQSVNKSVGRLTRPAVELAGRPFRGEPERVEEGRGSISPDQDTR